MNDSVVILNNICFYVVFYAFGLAMLYYKRVFFFEKPTDKARKFTHIFLTGEILYCVLCFFITMKNARMGYYLGAFIFVLHYIMITVNSFLSRKDRKAFSFFIAFPLLILAVSTYGITNILNKAIRNMEGNPITSFVKGGIFVIVILVIEIMRLIKNSPMQRIDNYIADKMLSFKEECGVCFTAIVLFVSIVIAFYNSNLYNLAMIYGFIISIIVIAAIINANARRYYAQQSIELQRTLINTMADLVESRDENTGGHIKRTAKYVEIIAKELQREGKYKNILTDKYIKDMTVAAPLHDIGKIHVSDTILDKPGKLTTEEYEIMKSHTMAGYKIIKHVEKQTKNIEYIETAKQMAKSHHEWMNGKGYPEGISGEQIPLCARIMAVADVFDALVSKRCYKEPMPLEKAYAIMREETGSHFDEEVIEAFFAARDEIENAMREE